MSFTDYIFFPFLFLLILIYFIVPKKAQWFVLLVASILFYCTYGIELLPFAGGAICVSWLGALVIQKWYDVNDEYITAHPGLSKEEKSALTKKARKVAKWILWLSVAAIVGVLVYIKAQRWLSEIPKIRRSVWFFSKVYQHIARWGLKIPVVSLFVKDTVSAAQFKGYSFFMPLGISYYTMSLTGYLADVYWKKEKAERNIFKLALFALYFPKILEGPISKRRNLAGQFEEAHSFDYIRLCHGLQRMLWGFLKKLCIADRLGLMVTPVFANYADYHGSVLLIAGIFGAFQLYCDFSGCMDIALGVSEILGITVEENFKQPFRSETAAEFWRRWHITLGVWFKDYIYMPLVVSPRVIRISAWFRKHAGKRAGKAVMNIIPLACVWLLTGLWHGTGWNYVLWGMYWGAIIILADVLAPEIKELTSKLHIDTSKAGFKTFRRLRTFVIFTIGRLIVLPGDLGALKEVISRIFLQFAPWHLVDQSLYKYGMDRQNFWLAIFLIIFLMFVDIKQDEGVVFREKIDSFALGWRWAIYLSGIFFVLIFGIYGAGYDAASFVYMNY